LRVSERWDRQNDHCCGEHDGACAVVYEEVQGFHHGVSFVREAAAGRARDHAAAQGKNIRSQISIACRWQERRPRLAGGDFGRSPSYGQRVVMPVDRFNRTDARKKAITSKVPLSGGPVDATQLLRFGCTVPLFISVARPHCTTCPPVSSELGQNR
jgi:hypothetical protein